MLNWGRRRAGPSGGCKKLVRCLFLHGNFAAPLTFAAVLSGAPIVAGLAATLAFAPILAFAGVLLGRRAPAVALATVLSGAAVVAGLAATLALAGVHALAGVLLRVRLGRRARGAAAQKRAHAEPPCRRTHQLSELPPVHSRILHIILHSERSSGCSAAVFEPGSLRSPTGGRRRIFQIPRTLRCRPTIFRL